MHALNVKRPLVVFLPAIYLLGILGILASGGSDGDGDGSVSFPTPELPDNAIVLDSTNARDIAEATVELTGLLSDVVDFKTDEPVSLPQIVKMAVDPIIDNHRIRVPAAAAKTEDLSSAFCISGTASVTYEESDVRAYGTFTYDNCEIATDILLDGKINFDGTYIETTQDYQLQFGGTLSVAVDTENITIVMNFKTSGNDGTGDFSVDASFSVDGAPDGGFLITTEVPVTGNGFSGDYTGGKQIVYGGTGALGPTSVEIVVKPPTEADVTLFEGSSSTPLSPILLP